MAKSKLGVRLYRSSVKGRRPAPADMEYGDLAVNYNHEDPVLIVKGDDNQLIEFRPGYGGGGVIKGITPLFQDPASGSWYLDIGKLPDLSTAP